MKNNSRKKSRLISLTLVSFMLLFISSIISPQIEKINNNDTKENEEELIQTPDVSNIDIHNITGKGSSVGLYGFTNGTREGNFDPTDTWTENSGYYQSEEYTIATPEYVTEQPWVVDANNVEVKNLKDRTNYIPDPTFTTDADWNETDVLSTYGSVEVDNSNNRGTLHFVRNTQTQNFNNFDNWDAQTLSVSPNRNQEPAGSDSGDTANAYSTVGTNIVTFTGNLDSYVHDEDSSSCSTGDNDDCYTSCSSAASIGDSLSVSFIQEKDYFYISEINNPQAYMSYDITFDDTYGQTSYRYGSGSPNYVESTTEQYTSTCRVRMFIKYSGDSVWTEAYDTGVITFTHSTSNYAASNVNVNNVDVSSALTTAGQYRIRYEVYFTFSNSFAGSSSDSDSCGGHCSITSSSWVTGNIDNRLRCSISDIDLTVEDLQSLPDGDLTFSAPTAMDFANREVEETFPQKLTFDVESNNDLSGDYGETRVYSRFVINKGGSKYVIDKTWGRIDVYINNPTSLSWDIGVDDNFDYTWLNGADSVQLYIGVKTKNFVLDWGSGTYPDVYFKNVKLTLEGRPDVETIDLEILGMGPPVELSNGASKGDGSATLSYSVDLASDTITHSFWSTSEKLTMDYYHTLELSYKVWGHEYSDLISHYITYGGTTVNFHLNFSVTTPYGSPADFQTGKAYQDNFYLTLIYPKFNYLGSSYWDLKSAYVDGKTKVITGQDNIGQVDENSNIYTPGLSPSSYYGDSPSTTQYGIMYNDLMDEWISGSSQILNWNILFEHPNVLNDLDLANNPGFSPETNIFISNQDTVYMRSTLGHIPEKGNASINILDPGHSLVDSSSTANGTITSTILTDSIVLGDLLGKDDYIADSRFTQIDITNTTTGDVCRGIYKVGFQKQSIDIVRDTLLVGPKVSHKIYNTRKDNGNIEIRVSYFDSGDLSVIADANAYITISDFETIGVAYKKNPILYNLYNWGADTPMINLGNGSYVIYADPSRNSDGTLAGNMTTGFHNFTIKIERNGYLTQTVQGNFSVEINTYLRHYGVLYKDDVSHQNSDLGWPHYVSGRPAGDPLAFQIQYVMNDSVSGSSISNRTGYYKDNVFIRYQLVNTTDGLVNWSAIEDLIGEGFNPINGSYYETANDGIFEMQIKWPTFDIINLPRYNPGIILEYNVTAYVKVNKTIIYDENGYIYSQFQPDAIERSTCENESSSGFSAWGSAFKVVEETFRFELVEYESVNKTQITLYNEKADNNDAFAMGTFDNSTHIYVIRNYYKNNTHDWFKIRAKFECTSILRDLLSDEAPPIGPLNETNEFYGKKRAWAGNTSIIASCTNAPDFELLPDETVTWTKEVNTTGSLTPINATGVTYVSPVLYYKDFIAGTYIYTIKAEKDGFQESIITLTIDVLPQKTVLYNNSGDTIDKTLNPIVLNTPRWNTTSFIIQYNDTTNPGEHETIDSIDSIEIIDDDTIDDRFTNSSGNHDYWGWKTLGNGKYEITIYFTDMDPQDIILIFNVKKQNYTTGEFATRLTIRRRSVAFNLVWTENNGKTIFCDTTYFSNPLDDPITNVILSYEILDLDNNTGGAPNIVDLRTLPEITEAQILSSFYVDGFMRKVEIVTDSSTGHIRYNITIGSDKALGAHTIETHFDNSRVDDFYEMPLYNGAGSIYIDRVSTNITITSAPLIEKTFLHYSQTRDLSLLPRYSFQYWDENHSIQIDPAGLILDGNWSNTWNNAGYSLDEYGLNEDIRLETSGMLGSVYFDIQMIDAQSAFYYTNITLNKTNYETVYSIMRFRILNQSTLFLNNEAYYGSLLYGETDNLDDDDLYIAYTDDEPLTVNWGNYLGFRFTYISSSNVYIANDTANGMPVSYSFESIDSNIISTLIDNNNGRYRFNLELENITLEDTIELRFNLTIYAKNFDPVTFTFNLTVIDRISTLQTLKSPDNDLIWTQIATFQIRFIDQEYYNKFGQYGVFYITSAEVNGKAHGNGDNITLDGLETNWWLEELPEGRYNIYINTTNLKVKDSAYLITFNFSKTHYKNSSIQLSLEFNPIPFDISATLVPGVAFVPEKQEELEIKVSLLITTYYWDAGRNVEEQLEVNVDLNVPDIIVTFEIFNEDGDSLIDGTLVWNSAKKAFVATISTDLEEENNTAGIFDLVITVISSNPNFEQSSTEIKLVALGTVEGALPIWFYPLLFSLIGASIAMAGYAIRKAIYLRIPFVLRKIDETIKKIEKDKYPAVGVMTGREEFIINRVLLLLDEIGIEWERKEKFAVKKAGEVEIKEKLEPLSLEEIQQALAQIPELSKEEIVLFTEELKRLNRDAQNEFIASLRGDIE